MGVAIEMCVCSPQKVIVPYSNTNIQNNGMNVCSSNLIIHNNNNIENIQKKENNNNAIVIKNEKNNNEVETYNNIQSNGQSTTTPKPKLNSNFSQIIDKKENNQSNKNDKNKVKSQNNLINPNNPSALNNSNKSKRRKSKSKKRGSDASINNMNNSVNNKEPDYEKITISETVLSELIINEKIKSLSKEKKKKIKGRNIVNIVIIGYNEVGKSSFCIRLVENKFEDFYIPSICNENFSKMMIYNEHNYRINFSVILGGNKIQAQDNILSTADFFLLIYDITKIRTFNQMNIYLDQIKKNLFFYGKDGKKPNFCLIGNKSDLEKERKVDMEIVNKFTKKYNANNFDISIKTLNNLNNIIPFLLKIFDKYSFSSK